MPSFVFIALFHTEEKWSSISKYVKLGWAKMRAEEKEVTIHSSITWPFINNKSLKSSTPFLC